MLADLLFLAFATVLLIAGVGVITAKNPMYCVLFMILAFFNAAGLFVLMGAEFLGLMLIMIYVGAIAVMFLFVLMTIDIDFAELKQGFSNFLPVGVLVGIILAAEFIAAAWSGLFQLTSPREMLMTVVDITPKSQNITALGQVLFTDYALPFLSAGMVLLVAMVGAIVLTHRRRTDVKRQNVPQQIARKKSESVSLTQPKIGKGATAEYWNPKEVE